MKNLVIDRKVNIHASFTPEQWQLYVDNEEVEEVAEKLNKHLEFLVNKGFPEDEVQDRMSQRMNEFSKYGAADTEPLNFLHSILNQIYK